MKKIERYVKSEKGSITTVVVVTVLFFLTILATAYMVTATLRKSQLKSEITAKSVYESDFNKIDEITDSLKRSWYISRESANSSGILLCWRNKR